MDRTSKVIRFNELVGTILEILAAQAKTVFGVLWAAAWLFGTGFVTIAYGAGAYGAMASSPMSGTQSRGLLGWGIILVILWWYSVLLLKEARSREEFPWLTASLLVLALGVTTGAWFVW